MEKLIVPILACLLLTGCFKEACKCGETPVYKRYNITMPDRPELTVDKLDNNSTIGQATRAYGTDLINVIEYSLQLETMLHPIAQSELGYEVKPTVENNKK